MVASARIIRFPEKPKRFKSEISVSISSFSSPAYGSLPDELPQSFAEYAEEYIDLNKELVREPERTLIVSVRGDSMEPSLFDGDKVIVSESLKNSYLNNLCVIYINGTHVVKWVKVINNKLCLVSENEKYNPIELKLDGSMSFYFVGVVTGSYRNYRVNT